MAYKDLRGFLTFLERKGDLKRIHHEVDTNLEITEICQRTLRDNGPALLFEKAKGFNTPVIGNLFGTVQRVADAMGHESISDLRKTGEILAFLK